MRRIKRGIKYTFRDRYTGHLGWPFNHEFKNIVVVYKAKNNLKSFSKWTWSFSLVCAEVQLSREVEKPLALASTRKRQNHNLDKKITEVNWRESLKAKFRIPRSSSVNRDIYMTKWQLSKRIWAQKIQRKAKLEYSIPSDSKRVIVLKGEISLNNFFSRTSNILKKMVPVGRNTIAKPRPWMTDKFANLRSRKTVIKRCQRLWCAKTRRW